MSGLDIADIDPDQTPEGKFPSILGKRIGVFDIVINRSVLNDIKQHGQSSLNAEVCGVLIGLLQRDPDGAFLHIIGSIRGEYASSQLDGVTFTGETWTHIQTIKDEKYPDERIVGWYHTHPGFGIFLSNMDKFIHNNFFNIAWQPAFVYDPLAGTDGIFAWQNDHIEPYRYTVHEDAAEYTPDKKDDRPGMQIGTLASSLPGIGSWLIPKMTRPIILLAIVVVAIVIALIASRDDVAENSKNEASTGLFQAQTTTADSQSGPVPQCDGIHGDPVTTGPASQSTNHENKDISNKKGEQ